MQTNTQIVANGTKHQYLQVRLNSTLKNKANIIFNKLGVSPSQAVRMFFSQVVMQKAIPFNIAIPKINVASKQPIDMVDQKTETRIEQAEKNFAKGKFIELDTTNKKQMADVFKV